MKYDKLIKNITFSSCGYADISMDYALLSSWYWRHPLKFLTQYSRHWEELEILGELNTIGYHLCVLTTWLRKHAFHKWFFINNNKSLALFIHFSVFIFHFKWTMNFTAPSGYFWDI